MQTEIFVSALSRPGRSSLGAKRQRRLCRSCWQFMGLWHEKGSNQLKIPKTQLAAGCSANLRGNVKIQARETFDLPMPSSRRFEEPKPESNQIQSASADAVVLVEAVVVLQAWACVSQEAPL